MIAIAHRSLTLLVLVLVCALPFGSAQAGDSENVATAIIEQDDGRAFDFAWDLDRQRGDDAVDQVNKAEARAHCARCQATAIAFQIVLVHGSPATVVPQNIAEAINEGCTECVAVAEARQFVRVTPQRVKLTAGGRAILSDVRRQLASLEEQKLPIDQLHQAVEAQEARVREVLADDLVLRADPDTEATVTTGRTLQSVDVLD